MAEPNIVTIGGAGGGRQYVLNVEGNVDIPATQDFWSRQGGQGSPQGQSGAPDPWAQFQDAPQAAAGGGGAADPWAQFQDAPTEPKKLADPGVASSVFQGALNGLSFGFAPRARAAIRSTLGLGNYDEELAAANESLDAAKQNHPVLTTGAEIAGSILSPASKIGAAVKGSGIAGRIVGGVRQGVIGGGLWGVSQSPDLTDVPAVAENAAMGAGVGGVTGGAFGTIGRKAAAPGTATGRQVAAAAQRAGVDIPVAATSDNLGVRAAGALVKQAPFGAGAPLTRAADKAIVQIGQATERTAAEYGGGAAANAATAGSGARAGLENYIGPVTSKRASAFYDRVTKLVDPKITTPLQKTALVAASIGSERSAAALDPSSAVGQVMAALKRPQGLNYEGIQKLRTSIGEQVDTGILPAGMSKGELKQLYAGLTQDLERAVQNSGGKAARAAFDHANAFYKALSARRENLARLLSAKNDEGVFDAIVRIAGSTSTADAKLLRQARESLPPDDWNKIASAAISRLGGEGDNFSPLKFLTAYGKLSPVGKDILFKSTGRTDLASALDDIATISQRFKKLDSLRNTSNTGPFLAGAGIVTAPVQTAAGLLGAYVMAHVLARPATAKALANWSKAYTVAVMTPSKTALASLKAASRQFAATIGHELGLDAYVGQMTKALADSIAPAQPQNDPQQRGAGGQQ